MSIVVRVKSSLQKNPIAPQRKNRGHVTPKKPDIDINSPGRLRSGHILALCAFSHSTLYARMKSGDFPPPDGKDGGLNFWSTDTVRRYLEYRH